MPWFINCLEEAIAQNKIIVDISQCKGGSVQLGLYETSRKLQQMGVVSGHDMTFEAAVTKLMYGMGLGLEIQVAKEMLERAIAGELTSMN